MTRDIQPWCRATIAAGTVTLNPWSRRLARGGPAGMVLEGLAARGIALADLYGTAGDELIVRYLRRSGSAESDLALLAWAHAVGWRRVWLADCVVELDPAAAPLGTAEVICPTCGTVWRDDGPEFWTGVRADGAFPGWCLACGGSLPEWLVAEPQTSTPRHGTGIIRTG